jgi:hypothetical protein
VNSSGGNDDPAEGEEAVEHQPLHRLDVAAQSFGRRLDLAVEFVGAGLEIPP